jgi:hypothetical protein
MYKVEVPDPKSALISRLKKAAPRYEDFHQLAMRGEMNFHPIVRGIIEMAGLHALVAGYWKN